MTVRPPLAGGNSFNYTWDAYDRLTTATRTGQPSVNYKYDALGRMLYRGESNGTTVSVNYWLGLSLLAQEQWGAETGRNLALFRPWIEAHSGPTSDGWYIYGGSGTKTLEYATDSNRGKVIHITTTDSGATAGQFIVGDKNGSNYNPNSTDWAKTSRKHLAFWAKNSNTSNHFQFTVYCRFSSGDNILLFDSGTGTNGSSSGTSTFYLGSAYSTLNDGGWHYIELDLQAYQRLFSSTGNLNDVDGIRFDCKNLYLDDPILSGGMLKRSYTVIPGAAINGALGSWTGPNVTTDNSNRVRFFQYNELGTVMAQTKADGSVEGAWEPDFYGNYENRQTLTGSPARPELGRGGKLYDPLAGVEYSNARWYDPQRGRWLSCDPIGFNGGDSNMYGFLLGNPLFYVDPTGLDIYDYLTDAASNGYGAKSWYGNCKAWGAEGAMAFMDVLGGSVVKKFSYRSGTDFANGDYWGAGKNAAGAIGMTGFSAFGGEILGFIGGRVLSFTAGKAAIGSARCVANTLPEQMVMNAAMDGAGVRIMKGEIKDGRFPSWIWAKMQYSEKIVIGKGKEGVQTITVAVHYWQNLWTKARIGFKFKD